MARLASFCLRAARRYSRMDEEEGEDDPLVWSRDLASQPGGEFSFAVVQANEPIEDQSQLEACPGATFVGIYDGHGGSEASRFVSDHLLPHLIRLAREEGGVSEGVIRRAFYETEEGFMGVVRRARGMRPLIAAAGSCCLAGIIWKGTLYAANLGDSRAVVGRVGRSNGIVAEQLTEEHNAGVDSVRRELVAAHPDDSHIVVLKHGVWRIKGIIQVSRSIGDAYLKRGEFRMDPAYHRFRLPEPLRRPVISAEPSISTKVLSPQDKFLIFASDGLWEHVTNQEAAEMVHSHPRSVTTPLSLSLSLSLSISLYLFLSLSLSLCLYLSLSLCLSLSFSLSLSPYFSFSLPISPSLSPFISLFLFPSLAQSLFRGTA
ncbi:putative protein phosphatase 2C 25 isoform X1 [Wolffia australiana]